MIKETVIPISDSESSTGSNRDPAPFAWGQDSECSSIAPAAPTTSKPSKELAKTSNKQNSQRVTTLLSSLPPPPPPTRYNKTVVTVVTSPPPPKPNKTTTVVSMAPQSPAALQINNNAAGSGARQQPPVGVTFSRSYGGGSRPQRPDGLTFSLPYGRGSGTVLQPLRVTQGGATFWQRYHPYPRQLDHQPSVARESSRRTVNFLSQMETSNLAPMQFLRGNPSNETLAEWGATLRLENGRSRPVDLNLKLRPV